MVCIVIDIGLCASIVVKKIHSDLAWSLLLSTTDSASIVVKKNPQWFGVVCTLIDNGLRASWVYNIWTPVTTNIFVDKRTDRA